MNRHRKATYIMRREILNQPDISKRIKMYITEEARVLAASPMITSDDFQDLVRSVFPFEESTLDVLFDSTTETFGKVLVSEAKKLYDSRTKSFGDEVMHKVERDVYMQILDNLWMQHLENMSHLKEGIHWISVGQRDPLVEYRRQGQIMFETMQETLRQEVTQALFSAEPISENELNRSVETELTRAARGSINNADRIIEAEEFHEDDFVTKAEVKATHKKVTSKDRKKAHKSERKRRSKGKKRK